MSTAIVTQSQQDPPAAGVTIELLNASGSVIATTVTNAQGAYQFTGLPVGVYSVQEVVPTGWFAHCSHVGSAGGVSESPTDIGQIGLPPDVVGANYNFCIVLPVSLSGVVYNDTSRQSSNEHQRPGAGRRHGVFARRVRQRGRHNHDQRQRRL